MQNDYQSYGCNGIGIIFSAIQTNEVLSWISWGITLFATLLSISFTIWKWWKKASEDGKITKDEIDELVNELDDDTKKLKDGQQHGKD